MCGLGVCFTDLSSVVFRSSHSANHRSEEPSNCICDIVCGLWIFQTPGTVKSGKREVKKDEGNKKVYYYIADTCVRN